MMFRVAAIVLMAIFYGCYFTKMLKQKKQGIETDQLGRGKEGFVRFIEVSLKTASCVLPLLQLIAIFTDTAAVPSGLRWAGTVLTALGVAAFVLSVAQMKDNWRAGVPKEDRTELVTDGIYSISRNPAFLGFDLMYLGLLISFWRVWLAIATAAALLLFHLQIVNVEEDFLLETFGDEYLTYCKRVCRYLGRKPAKPEDAPDSGK